MITMNAKRLVTSTTATDVLLDVMADEMAAELREQIGSEPIHFYMPVLPAAIVVDPDTLQPALTFRSRFGTATS
jgi:hypothetical protein